MTDDAGDIGRLLAWAAKPRDLPVNNEDYDRLVNRYRRDPDFAAVADATFAGAGLDLVVDDQDGVIAVAQSDSPLRVTLTDVMKRAQPHHRALIGAAVLALARTAYPDPPMLDDRHHLPVVTTQAIIDTLDRAAQAHADHATDDAPADDAEVEVWRRWLMTATARANAQRRSGSERTGIVNKACRYLAEAGYLTQRSDVDGGTWSVRPRFRHAVAALCEDSDLYAELNGLLTAATVPVDELTADADADADDDLDEDTEVLA